MTAIASADHNTESAYEFSISPSETHFADYVCSFDCGSEEHDESDTIEIRGLNRDILGLTIHNTGNPHLGTLIVRHYDNAGNLDGEITVNANNDRTMQLRFWNNLPDMLEISTTDSAFGDGVQYELEFNWDTTQRNQDWDQWIDDEDDCPTVSGESYRELLGCPDTDGDGWADTHDVFPEDNSQWSDQDGDGFGDNPEGTKGDECPEVYGTSTLPMLGCIDTDGDGWADTHDVFPENDKEWADYDGDGFGDNSDMFPEDSSEWIDTDLDGIGDNADVFPEDASETIDSDGDGFGDNIDSCPFEYGTSSESSVGCPTQGGEEHDNIDEENDSLSETMEDTFSQDSDLNAYIDSSTNLDVGEKSDFNQIPSQNTSTPFRMLTMALFGIIPISVIGIFAFMSGKNSERNRSHVRFEEMEEVVQNARNNARELEQSLQDSEIRRTRMEIWIDEAKRELAPENIILRAENYVRKISDQNTNNKNELEQIQHSLHTTRIEKEELEREIENEKSAFERKKRTRQRDLEALQKEHNEISEEIDHMKNTEELVAELRELKHITEQWVDSEIPAEIERLLIPLWGDIEI